MHPCAGWICMWDLTLEIKYTHSCTHTCTQHTQMLANLLHSMRASGVRPDVVTYSSLIDGLSRSLRHRQAERLWCRMRELGIQVPHALCCSVLQCVAVRYGVLLCFDVYCCVLLCPVRNISILKNILVYTCISMLVCERFIRT